MDGGVLNPLPIAPTLKDATALTVAVDVNGMDQRPLSTHMASKVSENEPEAAEGDEAGGIRQAIADFFDGWLPGNDGPQEQSMFEVALEAMDAMQVTISRLKASVYTPDVLVQVPRNAAHFFEFERAGELIDLGYREMQAELTALAAPQEPLLQRKQDER